MVIALEPGRCEVCTDAYHAGDELGLVVEGWAHLDCTQLIAIPAPEVHA